MPPYGSVLGARGDARPYRDEALIDISNQTLEDSAFDHAGAKPSPR